MEAILRHPVVSMLFVAMLAWSLLSLLSRAFGSTILLIIIVACVVIGIIAWMLRHDRRRLARVYPYPVCRQVINGVCKLTQTQAPVESSQKACKLQDELRLVTSTEFRLASEELRTVVRGHDNALEEILDHLRDRIALRTYKQQSVGSTPLASFLLVGESGVGKRYLAGEVGRRLYKRRTVFGLSLRDFHASTAYNAESPGMDSVIGILLKRVRSNPFQVIILDGLDCTPPSVVGQLQRILQTGSMVEPIGGTQVSFQHCVFFFIVSHPCVRANDPRGVTPQDSPRHRHSLTESLISNTPIDAAFLQHIGRVLPLVTPSSLVRAEVLLLLAERECQKYGVSLQYVDPRILADEVVGVSHELGFEFAPARIERLLQRPLIRVAKTNASRVALHQRDLEPRQ